MRETILDVEKVLAEQKQNFASAQGNATVTVTLKDRIFQQNDMDKPLHLISIEIQSSDRTEAVTSATIGLGGLTEDDGCFDSLEELGANLIILANEGRKKLLDLKEGRWSNEDSES